SRLQFRGARTNVCYWHKADINRRLDRRLCCDAVHRSRSKIVLDFSNGWSSARGVNPMRRRQFITLVGGAATAWPLAALAQGTRKPALVGWLTAIPLSSTTSAGVFLRALQDLGYVQGRDFQITYRSAEGYEDRLPALAEELVRLKPDVIVAA